MTSTEASQHALVRLANLLRKRFAPQSGREFVVLWGEVARVRPNTDELATQQIPLIFVR